MKVIILAGGKGTRLGELTSTIPKPLIPVSGKPVIEYQIELLKKNGFEEIFILVNYLGNSIKEYCKDGKKWGVNIRYYEENIPLGTAGGIKDLEQELQEDFLVLYGDLLVNMDLKNLVNRHKENQEKYDNVIGTLLVHPNNHPFDSDLVEVDENWKITRFLSKPHPEDLLYRNLVNAAVYVLSPEVMRYIPAGKATDFGKDIFPCVLQSGKGVLCAYNSPEYLKDMGTLDRLEQATRDVETGKYKKGSLEYKRPAVFIDRDGVINEEVGGNGVCNKEMFSWISGSKEAIQVINDAGYYAIVVTNQPVIAKGFCSYKDVLLVHKKMETELGKIGAKLDGIYFCPHHPERGFEGENTKYKKECSCRKPGVGLLKLAAKDLNIDLKGSFLVGDMTVEAMTAKNFGIGFVGVRTGHKCEDNKFSKEQVGDFEMRDSLLEVVRNKLMKK